jgi:hypothetical protein
MKRSLTIADPCRESWESMQGSRERRFCESCGKHVHSLSDMSPEEADEIVKRAKAGPVCVRVEHDGDGTVRFRGSAVGGLMPGRPHPLFQLAASASLLFAAGCGRADPPVGPDVPLPPAPAAVEAAKSADEAAPRPVTTAADPAPGCEAQAPADVAQAPADEAQAPATSAKARPGAAPAPSAKPAAPSEKTHVTMGCLCAPNDTLCDCL